MSQASVNKPFALVSSFIIWCGGGDYAFIKKYAPDSQKYYFGIGSIVLLVSVIAGIIGILTANLIFEGRVKDYLPAIVSDINPVFGLLIGILYGLLIFSLDRFLVVTTPSVHDMNSDNDGWKDKKIWQTGISMLLRLGLVFVIAHQLSLFLGTVLTKEELFKEIQTEWVKLKLDEQNKINTIWSEQIKDAQNSTNTSLSNLQLAINNTSYKSALAELEKLKPNPNSKSESEFIDKATQKTLNAENRVKAEISKAEINNNNIKGSNAYTQYEKDAAERQLESARNRLSMLQSALAIDKTAVGAKKTFNNHQNEISEVGIDSVNKSINAAKTSLQYQEDLQLSYQSWLKQRKKTDVLVNDFNACKTEADVCGKASVGIFTLIKKFWKFQKELMKDQDESNPITMFTWALIILELLALFLKFISDRGDYDAKKQAYDETAVALEIVKTAVTQANDYALHTSNENVRLHKALSDNQLEMQKKTIDDAEQISLVANNSLTRIVAWADSIRKILADWLNISGNQRGSAWALQQNLKYATDTSSINSQVPMAEDKPTALSFAIALQGSKNIAFFTGIFAGLLATLAYAGFTQINTSTNGFNFGAALIIFAAIFILSAFITFLLTSPSFTKSWQPTLLMLFVLLTIVVVLGLGAFLYIKFVEPGGIMPPEINAWVFDFLNISKKYIIEALSILFASLLVLLKAGLGLPGKSRSSEPL